MASTNEGFDGETARRPSTGGLAPVEISYRCGGFERSCGDLTARCDDIEQNCDLTVHRFDSLEYAVHNFVQAWEERLGQAEFEQWASSLVKKIADLREEFACTSRRAAGTAATTGFAGGSRSTPTTHIYATAAADFFHLDSQPIYDDYVGLFETTPMGVECAAVTSGSVWPGETIYDAGCGDDDVFLHHLGNNLHQDAADTSGDEVYNNFITRPQQKVSSMAAHAVVVSASSTSATNGEHSFDPITNPATPSTINIQHRDGSKGMSTMCSTICSKPISNSMAPIPVHTVATKLPVYPVDSATASSAVAVKFTINSSGVHTKCSELGLSKDTGSGVVQDLQASASAGITLNFYPEKLPYDAVVNKCGYTDVHLIPWPSFSMSNYYPASELFYWIWKPPWFYLPWQILRGKYATVLMELSWLWKLSWRYLATTLVKVKQLKHGCSSVQTGLQNFKLVLFFRSHHQLVVLDIHWEMSLGVIWWPKFYSSSSDTVAELSSTHDCPFFLVGLLSDCYYLGIPIIDHDLLPWPSFSAHEDLEHRGTTVILLHCYPYLTAWSSREMVFIRWVFRFGTFCRLFALCPAGACHILIDNGEDHTSRGHASTVPDMMASFNGSLQCSLNFGLNGTASSCGLSMHLEGSMTHKFGAEETVMIQDIAIAVKAGLICGADHIYIQSSRGVVACLVALHVNLEIVIMDLFADETSELVVRYKSYDEEHRIRAIANIMGTIQAKFSVTLLRDQQRVIISVASARHYSLGHGLLYIFIQIWYTKVYKLLLFYIFRSDDRKLWDPGGSHTAAWGQAAFEGEGNVRYTQMDYRPCWAWVRYQMYYGPCWAWVILVVAIRAAAFYQRGINQIIQTVSSSSSGAPSCIAS